MAKINGCVEYSKVLEEVIKYAKTNRKMLYVAWFDLQDAFGSVSHSLIQWILSHFHILESEAAYILDLYSKLTGKVKTKEWTSDIFKFLTGIFQGDPFSPIIFLMCFQPLLAYIQEQSDKGFTFRTHHIITLPFADDFNLFGSRLKTFQNSLMLSRTKQSLWASYLSPENAGPQQFVTANQPPVPFSSSTNKERK